MKKLPKLMVEGLGWDVTKKMCDFEQAKYFPYDSPDLIIVVEQQVIRSYDAFLKLVSHEDYKDRVLINVKLLPVIVGG